MSISWASAVLWFRVVIVCINCSEVVGTVEQDCFGDVVSLGILMIINYYRSREYLGRACDDYQF